MRKSFLFLVSFFSVPLLAATAPSSEVVSQKDVSNFGEVANAAAEAEKPQSNKDYLVDYHANLNVSYYMKMNQAGLQPKFKLDDVIKDFSMSKFLNDKTYVTNAVVLVQNGRIAGPSTVDTHPWYPDCVAILSDNKMFSGTLIANNLILTAAHCYDGGSNYDVITGNDISQPISKIHVPAQNFIRYPGYAANAPFDDVALIILPQPLVNIKPRRLASTDAISQAKAFTIVGFGMTDYDATIGGGKRRIGSNVPAADPRDTQHGAEATTELVAGKPLFNVDTCNGDSGGPIYVGDNSDPLDQTVAGCTSRPAKDSRRACGDGGIYERVDAFEAWIKQVANQHGSVIQN